MPAFFQRPLVRRCRTVFRWCRIFVWLVILVVVASIAYLHLIGLPEYLKEPLLRRLHVQMQSTLIAYHGEHETARATGLTDAGAIHGLLAKTGT